MTAAEYDSVAGVYDYTRRPVDAETLRGLANALLGRGCHSILEVGVGTGRVSAPLARLGVNTVGVDISRRMMEGARSKGLSSLLQADGTRTPFRDMSFDSVLLAHVIHIVDSPSELLHEAARVSRVGVFALLRKRNEDRPWRRSSGGSGPGLFPADYLEERRAWFRKLAEKYHWAWDEKRFRDWGKERKLLEAEPPDELVQVSDTVVLDTVEDRIARLKKGAYAFTSGMPPEMKEELIVDMQRRASLMPDRGPRHLIYQVAFWKSEAVLGRRRVGKIDV